MVRFKSRRFLSIFKYLKYILTKIIHEFIQLVALPRDVKSFSAHSALQQPIPIQLKIRLYKSSICDLEMLTDINNCFLVMLRPVWESKRCLSQQQTL